MNLTMNAATQVAYVYDWDQADWDAQASAIPWDYTIEFNPNIDESVITSLNTGRELRYDQRTSYVTEWIDNTMIVRPQIIYVQQLMPLAEAPAASGTP